MKMASNKSSALQRVLAKCQANIEAGNYYEAHQMYRTLYFRYNSQKRYDDAVNLLYNGSKTLLKYNQVQSGVDLALLMIDVLNQSCTDVTADNIDKIISLFKCMQRECPERQPYVVASLHWSIKVDTDHKLGHPNLHQRFGVTYWEEKSFSQSRYHLQHSNDGKSCASMLIEYHTTWGYRSEVDLFIAQAVLQYLCLQNKTTASMAFNAYTKDHPDIRKEGPPFSKPLLNFLWLLLIAVETPKLAAFTVLCEQYEASIKRDPAYKDYLDRIGQLFFGLPPPKRPANFLDNLIQSFITDGDDSDNSSSPVSALTSPSTSQSATRSVIAMDLD